VGAPIYFRVWKILLEGVKVLTTEGAGNFHNED